jgi:hypothetical protein
MNKPMTRPFAPSLDLWIKKTARYPDKLVPFLRQELKLGKRYVLLDLHESSGHVTQLLSKHLQLVCSMSEDAAYIEQLRSQFSLDKNIMCKQGMALSTGVENDSIDCIVADETILKSNPIAIRKEFERILRLNSYIVLLTGSIDWEANRFTKLLEQEVATQLPAESVDKRYLQQLFKHGLETAFIKHEVRLSWEGLLNFIHFDPVLKKLNIDESVLQKLFRKHSYEGVLALPLKYQMHTGLFNKSVPIISLRKSVFFSALRPFAFIFYILVKVNIYFWRYLFRVKDLFKR